MKSGTHQSTAMATNTAIMKAEPLREAQPEHQHYLHPNYDGYTGHHLRPERKLTAYSGSRGMEGPTVEWSRHG
jgi:hypothetical protein